MINLINSTPLFLVMVAALLAMLFVTKYNRLFRSAAILLGAAFFLTSSLPALAAPHLAALGASDRVLNQPQKDLEEQGLKLNPGGGQYSGVEDVPERVNLGQQLSDTEIENKIKSDIANDLVIDIKNGEVLLSGMVKNQETAHNIVEQVKQIPGVRQITFELGLLDRSNS